MTVHPVPKRIDGAAVAVTGLRGHFSYFLRKGPMSVAASAMPGLVNYIVIIYLTYDLGAAAAGEYRLLFSVFALTGFVTLLETSKVYMRAMAGDDRPAMTRLVLGRLYAALLAIAVAAAATLALPAAWLPKWLAGATSVTLIIAVAGVTHALFDLYAAHLQTERNFERFFLFALIKYAAALLVFVGLIRAGVAVSTATLVQILVMTGFHVLYFSATVLPRLPWRGVEKTPARIIAGEPREAALLSAANALPGSLEHLDKIIIGAVFGLEALGVYSLGFTTGRFAYNAMKPALYIYYRQFVDRLPRRSVVQMVAILFTIFGALCALGFALAVQWVPALHKFRGTEWIAGIIFLAYGVAMADAVYAQAYAINAKARSMHLLIANAAASLACIALFMIAAFMPVQIALLLFAAHYGVRHALTLIMLSVQRSRELRGTR